jgi:hypothetical protein
MGPYSEHRQLERKAQVGQLLQRDDLTEWARNYWSTVYDTLAMTEERYNARVVAVWTDIRKRAMKDWL